MKNFKTYITEKLTINKETSLYDSTIKDFLYNVANLVKKCIKNTKDLQFNRHTIDIKNNSIYIDFRKKLDYDVFNDVIKSIKQKVKEVENYEMYSLHFIIRTHLNTINGHSGITINVDLK